VTRSIRRTLAAAALTASVLLGGGVACGEPAWVENPAAAPAPASQAVPTPTSVRLDRLGIESSLVPTGVDAEGGFVIPEDAGQASWFVPGPEPGQNGRSIILGHVNLSGAEGVFAHLGQAREGDVIEIGQDGTQPRRWVVTEIVHQRKADWRAAGMYDELDHPEIALVTCSGDLVRQPDGTNSYDSNTILYARQEA
jgi:hypothetical protein